MRWSGTSSAIQIPAFTTTPSRRGKGGERLGVHPVDVGLRRDVRLRHEGANRKLLRERLSALPISLIVQDERCPFGSKGARGLGADAARGSGNEKGSIG